MTIQGLGSKVPAKAAVASADTCSIEMLEYIFGNVPFRDMVSCQSVCHDWYCVVRPIWILRVQGNLAYIQRLRTSTPSTGCENADIQVLIETAKAAGCISHNQALVILDQARTLATQLNKSKQTMIDAQAKILKVEACINKDRAIASICSLKEGIASLPAHLKAYADVKIAQIELCMGLDQAKESLQQAQQIFFQTTEARKQEIIQYHSGKTFGWGITKNEDLISIAWLEASVNLEKSKETILAVAREIGCPQMFTQSMLFYIIIQLGGGGMDSQQEEAYSQLFYTGIKPLSNLTEEELEANRNGAKVKPVKLENLEEAKQEALLLERSMDKALKLIEIARVEASFDVKQARATLQQVEVMVTMIPEPAYTIIALIKQILRT